MWWKTKLFLLFLWEAITQCRAMKLFEYNLISPRLIASHSITCLCHDSQLFSEPFASIKRPKLLLWPCLLFRWSLVYLTIKMMQRHLFTSRDCIFYSIKWRCSCSLAGQHSWNVSGGWWYSMSPAQVLQGLPGSTSCSRGALVSEKESSQNETGKKTEQKRCSGQALKEGGQNGQEPKCEEKGVWE